MRVSLMLYSLYYLPSGFKCFKQVPCSSNLPTFDINRGIAHNIQACSRSFLKVVIIDPSWVWPYLSMIWAIFLVYPNSIRRKELSFHWMRVGWEGHFIHPLDDIEVCCCRPHAASPCIPLFPHVSCCRDIAIIEDIAVSLKPLAQ